MLGKVIQYVVACATGKRPKSLENYVAFAGDKSLKGGRATTSDEMLRLLESAFPQGFD